jgi:Cu(I)/Ag(I) efflux system membrane fusion protein
MNKITIARTVTGLMVLTSVGLAHYLGQQQGRQQAHESASSDSDAMSASVSRSRRATSTGRPAAHTLLARPDGAGTALDKPGKSPYMDMPLSPV